MRTTPITLLSAATTVAALSVSGCSQDLTQPAPGALSTASSTSTVPAVDPGPLPAPAALSDVMARLADPAAPGAGKLDLVQNTAPADAAALDRFAAALRDTGFTPVTVSASGLRWSDDHPGNVLATITVTGAGSDGASPGEFSFPMEFARTATGWQLTRETADMLLAFGNAHPPGPTPPP